MSSLVLKLGSSILKGPDSIEAVVPVVLDYLKSYDQLILVVSAFKGVTDHLLRDVHHTDSSQPPQAIANYLATGELQSASLVTLALNRANLSPKLLTCEQIELMATGPTLDATLKSVNRELFHSIFKKHKVVVVPGFMGIGQDHQISLLGRGGSDYTAVYLAGQLQADCHLAKDVPGIYLHYQDLNKRYCPKHLTYEKMLTLNAQVLQQKALLYAKANHLPFTVGLLDRAEVTHVGYKARVVADSHMA